MRCKSHPGRTSLQTLYHATGLMVGALSMLAMPLCTSSVAALRTGSVIGQPLSSWRRTSGYRRSGAAATRKAYEPDPLLDQPCPVPRDQQPMLELRELKENFLFDWAELPLPQFCMRLASAWAAFVLTLGLPVSVVTFDLSKQPLECLVSASTGSLFLVTILVLRLYLGYSHVGSRLTSHKVIYEETGWHDAQVWVKTPQMLVRDRLLSMHSVKPALQRLKYSLYSLAGALVLSVGILAFSPPSEAQQQPQQQNYSQAPGAPAREYWELVEEYEPWALQGRDAPAAVGPGGGNGGHLLGTGPGVSYN